jgi:hypothetical protein
MLIDLKAFLISYAAIELVGLGVFPMVRRHFQPTASFSWFSVAKGSLERLVLMVGMTMTMSTVLVLFGALKIGTRIAEKENERISNDYFLVGNLMSVLLTLVGVGIYSFLVWG